MYLKRLELLGFKSFASRTVLELDRGVTALVGPNGSGKSNVSDAVRWALGEQSLRAVRSRKSEEVIFAGNSRRAPVGMAEVTLVLDNAEGALPLPFAEVSITRRQYRSGDGEYLINRARARLRDVVELLTHASLGPDSYAMVGQGAVDEVLLQRPEERRSLLEAAADISRHQLKLKESLDKLAQTAANIQRVDDIRGEIAPRLSKLRTQANRARRHLQLTLRLQEMLRWRYLLQLQQARADAVAALESQESREKSAGEADRILESSRERVACLRDQVREEEGALEEARERLSRLRLERAATEREAALAQERKTALGRQLEEVEEEQSRAARERQQLETELARLAVLRSQLVDREAKARAAMDPCEVERRRVSSEQRLLQTQLERAVAEQQAASARRSTAQERRAALAREVRKAEEIAAESGKAAAEAARRLAALEGQLSVAQEELEQQRARLAEAEGCQRETQARLGAVAGELEATRRKERIAWEQDNDLRNRLSLLQTLKEEHRGVPLGARTILEARLPGIRGPLASVIQVPQQYVTAVGAALGGAQGHLVSEGFREALEALRFLAKRPGKATIAPLRMEKRDPPQLLISEFRSRLDGILDGIAFRGLAADLVSCPPEAEGLCARYLGLSLVVESMADALELYRRLGDLMDGRLPYQVVTMDGRLLRARGDLSTATSGDRDGGLLAREAELVSLSEAVERAHAQLKESRSAVVALETAQADLARKAAEQATGLSELQAQISRHSAAYGELSSQMAKLEAAIEWNRSRAATAERDSEQSREGLARTEKDVAEVAKLEAEARGRAEQLRDDLAEQQSLVSEVAARLSRLQSEMAAERGQLREVEARLSAVNEAFQRAEARVLRQQEKRSPLRDALALLEAVPRAAPSSVSEGIEETEKLVRETSARVAQLRQGCAAAEKESAALSRARELAREGLSEAMAMAQRASVELESLLREAARELQVELRGPDPAEGMMAAISASLAGASAASSPGTLEAAAERAEALRRELASLGIINAEAPEEYQTVSERYAFLGEQLEDLRGAQRTLEKAIEELRGVMQLRFQETFDLVNAEFGRSFATLFGGGSARLILTQPEQPLDGGVDVMAAPPGRRGGSLLGLSGGERALTAVALLFALMKVNPSPFCLLDEVDAALDESNVHRFCDVVRSLAERTQFLVITHNRTTMEMASALYGASMGPDSISRVVSLRLASEEKLV